MSGLRKHLRIFTISIGWSITHTLILFTILVKEGNQINATWFLFELVVAVLASSQATRLEKSLKIWILSIFFAIIITMTLMTSPALLGVLDPKLKTIIIVGAIQPLTITLLLSTPLHLLGCFLGQVIRNRLT